MYSTICSNYAKPDFQRIKCRDCYQAKSNMLRCTLHPHCYSLHDGLDSDDIGFPLLRVHESTPVSCYSPSSPPEFPNYKSSHRQHQSSSKQLTSSIPSPQLSSFSMAKGKTRQECSQYRSNYCPSSQGIKNVSYPCYFILSMICKMFSTLLESEAQNLQTMPIIALRNGSVSSLKMTQIGSSKRLSTSNNA